MSDLEQVQATLATMAEQQNQLLAEVRTLRERLEAKPAAKRPGLTIKAFAEAAGVSRWTIQRDLKRGRLRKQSGRLPAEQLDKYTS